VPSSRQPVGTLATLPDLGQAGTLDELIERLRSLKVCGTSAKPSTNTPATTTADARTDHSIFSNHDPTVRPLT
jgi:hypothetical protein